MKKEIKFIIVILFCLFIFTGCSNNSEYNIEDKITEEIKYMESEMISIVNNFALGNYYINSNKAKENVSNEIEEEIAINEERQILEENGNTGNALDFDEILRKTRSIEKASNRMIVDLASKNIENGDLTKLSDGINRMISSAYSKDEKNYLIELNNVFSLFSNYEAKISNDSDEIFERRFKYFVISSYLSFIVDDKELAKTQITTLENEYLEKQKSVEYVEEHKYNLNKIYLLIQELKNGIETDSGELVKEKYLLLIDEI